MNPASPPSARTPRSVPTRTVSQKASTRAGLVVGYDAPRARSATADLDLAAVLDYVDAAALAPDAELRAGSC